MSFMSFCGGPAVQPDLPVAVRAACFVTCPLIYMHHRTTLSVLNSGGLPGPHAHPGIQVTCMLLCRWYIGRVVPVQVPVGLRRFLGLHSSSPGTPIYLPHMTRCVSLLKASMIGGQIVPTHAMAKQLLLYLSIISAKTLAIGHCHRDVSLLHEEKEGKPKGVPPIQVRCSTPGALRVWNSAPLGGRAP